MKDHAQALADAAQAMTDSKTAKAAADTAEKVSLAATSASLQAVTNADKALKAVKGEMPVGSIVMWAGDRPATPPHNWAICEGQSLSRNAYPELFAVIGTKYGVPGTPATEFRLPDLRSRFPLGTNPADPSNNTVNMKGGEKTHTLSPHEMPQHNHAVSIRAGGRHNHKMHVIGETNGDHPGNQDKLLTKRPALDGGLYTDGGGEHSHGVNQNNRGGNGAHNNMPPYISLNFVIRLKLS